MREAKPSTTLPASTTVHSGSKQCTACACNTWLVGPCPHIKFKIWRSADNKPWGLALTTKSPQKTVKKSSRNPQGALEEAAEAADSASGVPIAALAEAMGFGEAGATEDAGVATAGLSAGVTEVVGAGVAEGVSAGGSDAI